MRVRAGGLRHVVTIEQASETVDAGGGVARTWSKVADRRAMIRPLSGRELFQAQQVDGRVTYEITLRYMPELRPKMRIVMGSRTFNVISKFNAGGRDVKTIARCEEEQE